MKKNFKNKIQKFALFLLAILVLSYIALSYPPARNRLNETYNTAFVRVTNFIRHWELLFAKDQSPGVGPGNNPITVKDPEHFSFAVLGDTQDFELPESAGGFKKAVAQIEKMKPDLVMTVGDLVQSCNSTAECNNYIDWKSIIKPLLPITYEVVGNHDRIVGNLDAAKKEYADQSWQKFFNLPTNGPSGFEKFTYSFNIGNSHFVVLDSEKSEEHEIGSDQRDWLEKDLAANTQENTFVFYHEPAFPMSYKVGQSLDFDQTERDAFWTIIDKYNVTAVFNGHEHIYSRQQIDQDEFPAEKNPIYQFIMGNTDASEKENVNIGSQVDYYHKGHDFCIVEVNGKQISVKLYSVDGQLLDNFTFSK